MERRRAQAAPERLFSDPFPYGKHGFRSGMKLEGIDPEHQSLFCVMTVAEVQGNLIVSFQINQILKLLFLKLKAIVFDCILMVIPILMTFG